MKQVHAEQSFTNSFNQYNVYKVSLGSENYVRELVSFVKEKLCSFY